MQIEFQYNRKMSILSIFLSHTNEKINRKIPRSKMVFFKFDFTFSYNINAIGKSFATEGQTEGQSDL